MANGRPTITIALVVVSEVRLLDHHTLVVLASLHKHLLLCHIFLQSDKDRMGEGRGLLMSYLRSPLPFFNDWGLLLQAHELVVDVVNRNWLRHPAPLSALDDGVVNLLVLSDRITFCTSLSRGEGLHLFAHDFPEYVPQLLVVLLLECF